MEDNDQGIVLGDETGNIEVRSNVIRNNTSDGMLLIESGGNTIVENEVSRNGGDGIRLRSGDPPTTGNLIATNKVRDNGGNGITIGAGAITNTVKENKLSGNGGVDILDANGTPLVNTYADNTCDTSNPNGLCED